MVVRAVLTCCACEQPTHPPPPTDQPDQSTSLNRHHHNVTHKPTNDRPTEQIASNKRTNERTNEPQVVKVFMTKWAPVIDSSLLECERDVIVRACDGGNAKKVRHIVQDLYHAVRRLPLHRRVTTHASTHIAPQHCTETKSRGHKSTANKHVVLLA